MEPRLIQQQSQKLTLSPQIRQYLKLLQMPLIELSQAIETEMAENPLLEEIPEVKEEISTGEEIPADGDGSINSKEIRVGENFESFGQMDDNFQEHFSYRDIATSGDTEELQKKRDFQESILTKPQALSDFLLWQLRFLNLTDEEKRIAGEIVGNIDDDGYLRSSVEEITSELGAEPAAVETVLKQIQNLDPPGIGGRDLQEVLLIQLLKKGPEAAVAAKVVRHHLPLLEKRKWNELAKAVGVSHEEIKKVREMISRLEPQPGRTFFSEESLAVTPDASVSFDDEHEGKFKIEIHEEKIPELRINSYYRHLLRKKDMDEKTRLFLRDKMQAAVNFLKALSQRKSTLRAITEEIVSAQPEFFERGFSFLRPLRLKDISQVLGIHESTVSRAIHGKYVVTPQGTIPYKSFFSTKLDTTSGGTESQKSIMEKIKVIVEKEPQEKPLSDEEIVKILRADGLMIARRTVAKYRELLKILPSHLRRNR